MINDDKKKTNVIALMMLDSLDKNRALFLHDKERIAGITNNSLQNPLNQILFIHCDKELATNFCTIKIF